MSSAPPSWTLRVPKHATKELLRAPRPERERLLAALEALARDPFAGDVEPLKGQPNTFRRRVGNWRLFFDVDRSRRLVDVTDIVRRTTTTYRKR